jgi:mono/diheme cytochrome c family protein
MARRVGVFLVIGLAIAQFSPFGRDHANPIARAGPAWDSPRTRELAARTCYQCHSNRTVCPWHSNVAPISWLIQSDVERRRSELSYSALHRGEAHETAETVLERAMPPWHYVVLHPDERLSDLERDERVRGLNATFDSGDDDDH